MLSPLQPLSQLIIERGRTKTDPKSARPSLGTSTIQTLRIVSRHRNTGSRLALPDTV